MLPIQLFSGRRRTLISVHIMQEGKREERVCVPYAVCNSSYAPGTKKRRERGKKLAGCYIWDESLVTNRDLATSKISLDQRFSMSSSSSSSCVMCVRLQDVFVLPLSLLPLSLSVFAVLLSVSFPSSSLRPGWWP